MRYLLRRVLHGVVVLVAVSILSFLLLHLAPGEFFAEMRLSPQIAPGTVDALRAQYGLDRSLPVQYGLWLRSVSKGEFGYSFAYNQPVSVAPLATGAQYASAEYGGARDCVAACRGARDMGCSAAGKMGRPIVCSGKLGIARDSRPDAGACSSDARSAYPVVSCGRHGGHRFYGLERVVESEGPGRASFLAGNGHRAGDISVALPARAIKRV